MRILRDFEGRAIRLTEERLQHILEHPEMLGLEHVIEETLAAPEADAFVVTAYLTDRVKKGQRAWPTEK